MEIAGEGRGTEESALFIGLEIGETWSTSSLEISGTLERR